MTNVTRRCAILGLTSLALPGCAATAKQSALAPPRASCATAPLIVHGAKQVAELAPMHLALRKLYGPNAAVQQGSVASLVGPNPTADVAANGETQQLLHSLNGPDMRVLMTVAEGHYFIVARRSAGINKLADLKGKRVATIKLTTAGYFLHKMLGVARLSLANVTLVERPYGKVAPAFISGDADALAMWEPEGDQALHALKAKGEDVVVFKGDGVYYERYNLCTTAALAADPCKRREIVSFMRAIIAATDEMNRNSAVTAEAQAMVARSGNGLYPLADIASSWPNTRYVASYEPDMLDLFVEQELWLAAEQKRSPRFRKELAPLFDPTLYAEAKAL